MKKMVAQLADLPQTGSAGALGATNAGRAAAAPRALVPSYRFHQRIARRSLYGFKMAVPAAALKNSCRGRAGMGERLPFIGTEVHVENSGDGHDSDRST
jgi:hypothetical protein